MGRFTSVHQHDPVDTPSARRSLRGPTLSSIRRHLAVGQAERRVARFASTTSAPVARIVARCSARWCDGPAFFPTPHLAGRRRGGSRRNAQESAEQATSTGVDVSPGQLERWGPRPRQGTRGHQGSIWGAAKAAFGPVPGAQILLAGGPTHRPTRSAALRASWPPAQRVMAWRRGPVQVAAKIARTAMSTTAASAIATMSSAVTKPTVTTDHGAKPPTGVEKSRPSSLGLTCRLRGQRELARCQRQCGRRPVTPTGRSAHPGPPRHRDHRREPRCTTSP